MYYSEYKNITNDVHVFLGRLSCSEYKHITNDIHVLPPEWLRMNVGHTLRSIRWDIIVIACRHGIYDQNDPSPLGLRPRARAVSDDKSLATC